MRHDKLVRDLIPQLIEADGHDAVTRVLEHDEFFNALKNKLREEVEEYIETEDIEELADVIEIIRALLEMQATNYDELEQIRFKKLQDKGGFIEKIYLEEIIEN